MNHNALIHTDRPREFPTETEFPAGMEGLVVRQLIEEDAEQYYDQVKANSDNLAKGGLLLHETYIDPDDVASRMEDPDARMYGVWYHDKLIGGLDMVRTDHPNEVEVVSWIDEAHQQQGFGTRSKHTMVNAYVDNGFTVKSEVFPSNITNIHLLGKIGFKRAADHNGRLVFKKSPRPTPR